jgi:hypothetical protein
MSRKAIVLSLFGLALLAGLSIPAHAEDASAVTAPALTTPAPAGCGLSLAPEPAVTLANPVPEPLFGGRTCRCSCGFPCKKDADCGPGGICSGGITCC